MPIYEYRCEKCGEVSEILVLGKQEVITCQQCGSEDLVKLMSAHHVLGSSPSFPMPEPSGGCCESPNSCGAPGSCCSK